MQVATLFFEMPWLLHGLVAGPERYKKLDVTGRYTISRYTVDNVKNCMANPNFCRDLYLKPLLNLGLVTN